jgi:Fur family transcriptional regulator, ferric uptake regulator
MDMGGRSTASTQPVDADGGADHCVDVGEVLRANGLRRTKDRLAVAALLAHQAQPGHLSAAEISRRLLASGHQVDRATVYRVVSLLVDLGVLHATTTADGATSYGTTAHPHHHLRCRTCGRLDEIPAEPLDAALHTTADAAGYTLDPTGLTFDGTCRQCAPTAVKRLRYQP